MSRALVGAVPFDVMSLSDAVTSVLDAADRVAAERDRIQGMSVHFCNAYHVALARQDAELTDVLTSGDLVFCDGVPVTWVGKRAYPQLAEAWDRVYGPDVMRGVLAASTLRGPRHYLLGSTPQTLEALQAAIARDFPHAVVAGSYSPPFQTPTADDLRKRDELIESSGADIVWVGLGTPKQDYEVQRLAASLPVVAIAVGAAFDFLAGTKAQAPVWVQRSGLEWAFRLASEPRRLGRRYVWGNSVFVREAIRTLRQPAPTFDRP